MKLCINCGGRGCFPDDTDTPTEICGTCDGEGLTPIDFHLDNNELFELLRIGNNFQSPDDKFLLKKKHKANTNGLTITLPQLDQLKDLIEECEIEKDTSHFFVINEVLSGSFNGDRSKIAISGITFSYNDLETLHELCKGK